MDLQLLKTFLLWNLSINYLIIIVWFAAFVFAHDGVYWLHNRFFPLFVEYQPSFINFYRELLSYMNNI
ncbi:DUF6868 family protein [Aeromonas dhakensis]|uniref:DUF6868 family protein n=1 Tax=Aeromonas dhakensis TaxID=196024 RepID=UPI003B9E260F